MKIRFQVQVLNAALDVVNVVQPRPSTADAGPGFLFVVREGKCLIYSKDQTRCIRVPVAFEEVDGDGSFVFPHHKVDALKYLDGWIDIESGSEKKEKDKDARFWISYRSESGDEQEASPTVNPGTMTTLDEFLDASKDGKEFQAALLREAINATSPYLAKADEGKVEKHFQTLQFFDESKEEWKKGDGYSFAADGIRTCYFYCDKFKGKGLALHAQHLSTVGSFLAKCHTGMIRVRHGASMTFLINANDQVLGLAHNTHNHPKFHYYPLLGDQYVLHTDKEPFIKALRYMRASLDKNQSKIHVKYDPTDLKMVVTASERASKVSSRPVVMEPVPDPNGKPAPTEPFEGNADLNHFIDLVEPIKGHRVLLRVACVRSGAHAGTLLFRTIDTFFLDEDGRPLISKQDVEEGKAAECQVTRFMPGRA